MEEISIARDVRILREIAHDRGLRYRRLLNMRIGDVTQTSAAVGRLKRAGYVTGDDRGLYVTDEGAAALGRLDDENTRRLILWVLFYGLRRRA